MEVREEGRREEIEKNERLKKVAKKKTDYREKIHQKKLTDRWLSLPEGKREKFRKDEEKRRRLELK